MPDFFDASAVSQRIESLAAHISKTFSADAPLNIVGIRTRGETIASRIAKKLREGGHTQIGRGVLDITLYRDDLSEVGPRPIVHPTNLSIDIDRRPLVLVDDVLFTGRTVRAALGALADFGRPSVIRLAVLVDRGGRELPIVSDFTALKLGDVRLDHRVKVSLVENDAIDEIRVEPIPARGGRP